jgi:hypothetical protein
MLISAIISGLLMGFSPVKLVVEYGKTIKVCAYSLLTISAMLAIGTLTRLSGVDATLGLAFAGTGVLYPFFGTLLGWLGVALTGSDTSSNILFGNLQKITATQLGISPILMAAANSSGGVMGKMIDAQSIVVASTATNWFGHEGTILRFVFKHSIALACLVGVLVMLQAYVFTCPASKDAGLFAMPRAIVRPPKSPGKRHEQDPGPGTIRQDRRQLSHLDAARPRQKPGAAGRPYLAPEKLARARCCHRRRPRRLHLRAAC